MESYLDSILKQFAYYKQLGERAMAQLDDQQLFEMPGPDSNSIDILVKHMAGNMLSRFTDFRQSDGEKTWRNRDQEFVSTFASRNALMEYWEKGWNCVFEAVRPIKTSELSDLVYIRNQGHTIIEALNRQLAHYAYHTGQMVYVAKTLKGKNWQSLSIPKGESTSYNAEKFAREKKRGHFTDEYLSGKEQ